LHPIMSPRVPLWPKKWAWADAAEWRSNNAITEEINERQGVCLFSSRLRRFDALLF